MDSTELQTFDFNFSQVRVQLIDGEPWFLLLDLCRALNLQNPSMVAQRLQPTQRTKLSLGRQGEALFVSESGMYRTVLRSDSPNAEPFQVWVTEDVIPTIRKTGRYTLTPVAPTLDISDPLVLAQQFIQAETARRALAAEVEVMTPKAQAFDTLMESSGTYSVSAAAKLLGMGEVKLFALLRHKGILMDRQRSGTENHNVPYQKHLDARYFEVVTKAAPDGIHVSRTTRVTTRGLAWLQGLLESQQLVPTPQAEHGQQLTA